MQLTTKPGDCKPTRNALAYALGSEARSQPVSKINQCDRGKRQTKQSTGRQKGLLSTCHGSLPCLLYWFRRIRSIAGGGKSIPRNGGGELIWDNIAMRKAQLLAMRRSLPDRPTTLAIEVGACVSKSAQL